MARRASVVAGETASSLHGLGMVPIPMERVLSSLQGHNPRGSARPLAAGLLRERPSPIDAAIDALGTDYEEYDPSFYEPPPLRRSTNGESSPLLNTPPRIPRRRHVPESPPGTPLWTAPQLDVPEFPSQSTTEEYSSEGWDDVESLGGHSHDLQDAAEDGVANEYDTDDSFIASDHDSDSDQGGHASLPTICAPLRSSPTRSPPTKRAGAAGSRVPASYLPDARLPNGALAAPVVSRRRNAKAKAPAPVVVPEIVVTQELLDQLSSAPDWQGIITLPEGWGWRDPVDDEDEYDPNSVHVLPADIQGKPFGSRATRRIFATCLTPSRDEFLKCLQYGLKSCKFSSLGLEICPSTGRPHIHCYWHHVDTKSPSVLKGIFPRFNLQNCGGTELQCRAYTSKDGHGFVMNELDFGPGAGARMDLLACGELLLAEGHAGLIKIAHEQPNQYILHHRGMQAIVDFTTAPRNLASPPSVTWIMGRGGSGKTTLARSLSRALEPTHGSVFEMNHLLFPWVEFYRGQKVICIQDIRSVTQRGTRIEPVVFLKMWDVTEYVLERKGGAFQFQGEHFFITCTIHPAEFYQEQRTGIDSSLQFLRRITRVIECEAVDEGSETIYSHREIKRGPRLDPWPLDFSYM